jgi:tetratricopeptide (TPR) repeat protein
MGLKRTVMMACALALAVLVPLFGIAMLGLTAQLRHARHECEGLVSDDELSRITGAEYTPGPETQDSATGCRAEWISETSVDNVTLTASADQRPPATMVAQLEDRSLDVRSLKLGDWAVVGEGDGVATAYVSSCGVLLTLEADGSSAADEIEALAQSATQGFQRLCKFSSPWPAGLPWVRSVKYVGPPPAVPEAADPARLRVREKEAIERATGQLEERSYAAAARSLERALRLHDSVEDPDDADFAAVLSKLGRSYRNLQRLDESEKVLRRALAIVDKSDRFRVKGDVLTQLGQTLVDGGHAREGLKLSLRALALHDAHRTGPRDDDRMSIVSGLASAYGDLGDHKNEAKFAALRLKAEEAADPESWTATVAMNNLALAYRDGNRVRESILLFERSLKVRVRIVGADSLELIPTLNNLAGAYYFNDNMTAAEAVARRALEISSANGEEPEEVTTSVLSDIAAGRGDYNQALSWLDQSLDRLQRLVPQGKSETLRTRIKRAVALAALGRDDESRDEEREVVALAAKLYGAGSAEAISAMTWLAGDLESVAGADRGRPLRDRIAKLKGVASRR